MAAAVRALLRRRAAAPPSLALLQPLFPGPRYSTPRSPLLAAAAVGLRLPDVRCPQLSPAPGPPLLRYYSSKPSKDVEYQTRGLLEDLEKHTTNLVEALQICKKANALLNEGLDNKTVAMFDNGLEKAFEALADREKALDDFSGALSSSNALSKDTLQQFQMLHQHLLDDNKFTRQVLNDVQMHFVAVKIRNKVNVVDLPIFLLCQKKPNELSKFKGTAVAFGMCLALTVLINVTFSYSIHI